MNLTEDSFAFDAMLPNSEYVGYEGIHEAQRKAYNAVRGACYTVFAVVFGFGMSLIWGFFAAMTESLGTYCCTPAKITCNHCLEHLRSFLDALIRPCTGLTTTCCAACGAYWSSISVKMHNTQGADVSEAKKDLMEHLV